MLGMYTSNGEGSHLVPLGTHLVPLPFATLSVNTNDSAEKTNPCRRKRGSVHMPKSASTMSAGSEPVDDTLARPPAGPLPIASAPPAPATSSCGSEQQHVVIQEQFSRGVPRAMKPITGMRKGLTGAAAAGAAESSSSSSIEMSAIACGTHKKKQDREWRQAHRRSAHIYIL